MLNTGFFMMRSTAWSVAFLEDAYDSRYNVFVDHPWWEQSSMFYLMVNMCPHEYTSKIVHVHQNIVNPYPKEYSNPIHQHYQEVQMFYDGGGVVVLWCCFLLFTFCFVVVVVFFCVFQDVSFMLAFSGCTTYISNEACNALYVKYAQKAMEKRK